MRTIRRVFVRLPVIAIVALTSVIGTTAASAAPAPTIDDAGLATLAVRQLTRGAGGGPFHFELSDGTTPASVHGGVATTTADGDAVDVSGLVGTLAPGSYTLRQDLTQLPADPTGGHWEFTGVECAGAPVTVDAPNGTATMTLEAGTAATCVVTDTWVATTNTSAEEVAPTTDTTNPPTTTAPDPPTTAAPTPTADDGDGVAATIEHAAPNGGDGNRDGLVDSRQSNVASLPAAVDVNGNGALDDYVTIVAPEGTTLTNVRALRVPSDNPPPDGVRLPYGLFDYDVGVASPGAAADVTYVLPAADVAPTSVHMLQHGVWTDFADHTSVDAVDAKVTVALRDGGAGDATATTDGVINDPSGPSTNNQTVTVTNTSGASAPNFTFRLERCSETSGTSCTGATPVGTASGAANASGDSTALGNGSSFFWGSGTALDYERNYRLSVITPLPASGWGLTARNCNPDGSSTTNSGTTAIVMRLSNSTGNQRATCTFTFAVVSGTITVHKGGTRSPSGTNGTNYAAGLPGAVFESSPQNANTWSDLCTTDANGNCTSAVRSPGTYDVREKSAPAGWSTISQLVFGGNSAGTGNQTHPYVGTATVGTTGSANVSVQRTNTASQQDPNHRFINVRDNHALPTAQCGITLALVLDRSGSIAANRQAFIDAVNGVPGDPTQLGLLGSLAGTPTTIKIYSFAEDATGPSANFDLSTAQGLTDARAAVTAIYNNTGGGTNWDAGLAQTAGSGAPVTIFLTDGNPTTWTGAPNGGGSNITLNDLTAGVASANSIKGTSTIFAVGAGSGVTASNLELVSSPDQTFVGNITGLENALRALANQFCGSRIHVRKLVGGQPQTGWSFTAAGGGAVTFGNNPAMTAGVNGENVIAVDNIPATGTAAAVTVTESLAGHAGFSLTAAACQLNGYPAADTGTPTNPQSIAQIQRNQDWFCTFNNVFTKFASTTATVIHNAAHATVTSVPVGTTVHDQATVTGQTGQPVPTGTVTFSWFTNGSCTAPAAATSSAFTLAGGVADGTTFPQTPNVSGSFAFRATYSGDNIYTGSTGPCEPLTVTTISSTTVTVIHNASHATVTTVPAGTIVHDQATVSGALATPTGTVTFSWFTNGSCTAPAAATSSAFTLAGGVADGTTFTQTPNVSGSFTFRATYSGDNIYTGSTGPCEPLTVTTVASSTATVIHDAAHATVTSVPVGTTVHDQATVTGQAGLPVPTGTVTFRWFTTDLFCTGIPAATSSPFTLDGSGVADGTTFPQTPVTFGTFSFRATYSGDGTYTGSVGPCEPLLVTRVSSTTATVIHDAAHATVTSVPVGTTVHDQATVTGQAGLPVPTGTVTFSWFTNGSCTAPAAATSSTFTLAGGVADGTTFPQTPNVSGSFAFRATYSGDNIYTGSTGPCEPLTVTTISSTTVTVIHNASHATVTTVPAGTIVHDQATVSGALATPTGTVTFSWFTNGSCTAPAAATSSAFTLAGGVADGTTFTQTPNVSGSFAFRATYSGDNIYTGSTGPCEPLTVTTVASSTATVIHDAAHATVTSVPVGTTVHDQATVTGQAGLPVPTGTVTFRWFTTDLFCTGIPAATSSPFTLDGSGVADGTTFPQTPVTFGTFSFRATYSGDGTYTGSVGPCEPLLVTRVSSTTATVIHDAAHATVTSVPVGTTVHDQATVTGQAGLPVPTGTVTFSWFTNGSCTAPAAATSSAFTLAGGVADGTTFTQTPGFAGSFAFQATYSGDGTYTGSTGPCEPLTVQSAAISISKTSTVTQIVPGGQVPYTLTVTNSGPVTATGVVVSDVLPAGLTFVSSDDPGCSSGDGVTVTCALGDLAAGTDVTVNIVTDAADPFPADAIDPTGSVPNTATVTAPNTNCPPDASGGAECASTLPLPIISLLTLVKVVINDSGGNAQPTDWTLTADGPTRVSGVTGDASITNAPVSPGVYTVSESDVPEYVPTGFDCEGGTQDGDTVTLAPGESATCTVTNDDIEAEITILKSSSATAITPGSTVPYSYLVTNVSAATAHDVIVTDPLPAGLTFVSSPDGCTADASQMVTCTTDSLAPGASITFNIVTLAANPFPDASVDPDGEVSNTATVTSPNTNCPPSGRAVGTTPPVTAQQATADDCTSTDPLPLLPTLTITKTSAATEIVPGAQVPYTITVTNTAPSVAPDVVVTDTLPAGLSFVSSVPACTASGQVVTCPLGDLAAGTSATIDLVTLAQNPFPVVTGQVINVAVVVGSNSNCGEGSGDPACRAELPLPVASVGGESVEPANGNGNGGTGDGLPFTGSSNLPTLIAGACLFVGLALLGVARRRRRLHSV